jgi:hypothetical protein
LRASRHLSLRVLKRSLLTLSASRDAVLVLDGMLVESGPDVASALSEGLVVRLNQQRSQTM